MRFVVGPLFDYTPVKQENDVKLTDEYTVWFQIKDAEAKLSQLRTEGKLNPSGKPHEFIIIKCNFEQDVIDIKNRGILYSDLNSGKYNSTISSAIKKRKILHKETLTEERKFQSTDEDEHSSLVKKRDEVWFRKNCQTVLDRQTQDLSSSSMTMEENQSSSRCVLVSNKNGWLWYELSKGMQGRYENNSTPYRCVKLPIELDNEMDSLCHFYAGWLSLQNYLIKFLGQMQNVNKNGECTVDLLLNEEDAENIKYHQKLAEYDLSDEKQLLLYNILKKIYYRIMLSQNPNFSIKWNFKYNYKNEYDFRIATVAKTHLKWIENSVSSNKEEQNKKIKTFNKKNFFISFSRKQQIAYGDLESIEIRIKEVNQRKRETQFSVEMINTKTNEFLWNFVSNFHSHPQSEALLYINMMLGCIKLSTKNNKINCKICILSPYNQFIKDCLSIDDRYKSLFSTSFKQKSNCLDIVTYLSCNKKFENPIQLI